MTQIIAFQGEPGAYSDLACRTLFPAATAMPCLAFEDAFAAVQDGRAERAMIPIENSVAGRVADVHHLLPDAGLAIVAEHYQPVVHQLLGLPGAQLAAIREAHSHPQALAQCRKFLRARNIQPVVHADTAGAAAAIARRGDPAIAAIASTLAGELYGLRSLQSDIADLPRNLTRFVVLARAAAPPPPDAGAVLTTLIYRVRSVPAALYKTLGGFATNGINITKIESYLVDGDFSRAQFRLDVEAHPAEPRFQRALAELGGFADAIKLLGTYPVCPMPGDASASTRSSAHP